MKHVHASATVMPALVAGAFVAPPAAEASMLPGWRFHPDVRVLGGMSTRHIRWPSIRHRAPSEQPLPDDVRRRRPDGLRLTTVHPVLGVGFVASELFAK